jgi:hypothetical protein
MNIRATSSAFMALRPPWTLALHADRLVCWKLGGFATAVICNAYEVFASSGCMADKLANVYGMLLCRDLPMHLDTTTWALRLSPPVADLKS